MNDSSKHIIELDLQRISKQYLIWTVVLSITLPFLNSLIHKDWEGSFNFWSVVWFIVGYVVLIALHELFHLIGFVLFGRVPIRSLRFGVNLKMGVAYATTTEWMTNRAIRGALILPFWMTGVLPAVFGLLWNSQLLMLLAAWLIAGALGDFVMIRELKKFPNDYVVKDDPEKPKLYIYENTAEID